MAATGSMHKTTGSTPPVNRRVLAGLILAIVLPALDLMALSAAAPDVAGDLGRLDQVAWLFVSYQLAFVVSVPLYGKLGDIRGRRMVFLSAVSIFTISSLVAGIAWSFPVLIVSRIAQGLGGGGILSQSHAVIADLVPPRERGRYSWVTPTVWTVASFLGPVFGGALADYAGWRWIFLVNLPFGLLSMWFVRDAFPNRRSVETRSFDLPGAALLVVSYGALIFCVSAAGDDVLAWSHPVVVGGLLGGAVVFVGFVAHELRSADPVVPLRLLRVPVVRACAATTTLIGSVAFLAIAFLPLMLQVVTDISSTEAGLAILPTTMGIAVASTVIGRLVVRTGHYRLWPVLGSAFYAGGYFALTRVGADPQLWKVWIGTLLLGLGMGMGSPVFILAMQNAVPQRDVGVVSAMAVYARHTGQAFGIAIAGAVFVTRLTHHIGRLVPAERLGTLGVDDLRGDIDAIRSLDPDVEVLVAEAFRLAVNDLFWLGVGGAVLSLLAAMTIPQLDLRETLEEA